MTIFRCGHPRTPDNTVKNGGTAVRCRACKQASEAARRAANPDAARKGSRDRLCKSRGGLKGHRNAQKTTCPEGHPYDAGNTYYFNNTRQCKKCRRIGARKWWNDRRSNGGSHSETEWLALCAGFDNHCLRCGSTDLLTRDHVIPVSKGGTNNIENIQPLCRPCNSSKKDKHIDYRPAIADPQKE